MPNRVMLYAAICLLVALAGCEQGPRERPPGLGPVVSNGYISLQLADDGMPTLGRDKVVVQSQFVNPKSDERVASDLAPYGMTILIDGKRVMPAEVTRLADNKIKATSFQPGVTLKVDWEATYQPVGLTQTVHLHTDRLAGLSFEKPNADPRLPWKVSSPVPIGPQRVLQPHQDIIWTRSWTLAGVAVPTPPVTASIQIDGPGDDQAIAQTALEAVSREVGSGALGPFGITSDRYAGRMFWDSDVYVLPALAFLNPTAAKQVPDARLAQLPSAEANFSAWYKNQKVVWMIHPAAKFAWEAGKSGLERSTAPTSLEAHGSASVAFGLRFAASCGLADPNQVEMANNEVANFYLARITTLPDGRWGIDDTVSPDEWHTVNNDLYTNLAVAECFRPGDIPDPAKVIIPHDAKGIEQFAEDDYNGYQQTAGLLAVWPLQHPVAEKNAAALFDRYADRVSADGPAMSHQISAIVASRIGRPKVAYREWTMGWQRFSDDPEWEFREKEQFKTGYFVTGAAGILDSLLYGFLGFRVDDHLPLHKLWTHPLQGGHWLSIDPHLPPQWKSVRIHNLQVMGQSYDLVAANGGAVTVSPVR